MRRWGGEQWIDGSRKIAESFSLEGGVLGKRREEMKNRLLKDALRFLAEGCQCVCVAGVGGWGRVAAGAGC